MRKLALVFRSLVVLQIAGVLGFIAIGASAQSDNLVAVLSLYTGRNACEVQYRKSDNDQWGEDSRDGPPIACTGGMIVTEIVTQAEADEIIADRELRGGSELKEIRTISLSGNESTDIAAIDSKRIEMHTAEAAQSGVSLSDSASFMSPETFATLGNGEFAPSAAVLAAKCKQGQVGQNRRADFAWNHKKIGVTVKAYVYYKRISCANWKITKIESRLLGTNYPLRIWLRDIEYTKMWSAAQSQYIHGSYWLGCPEVFEGRWITVNPSILIQANNNAQLESIDTNPNSPDVTPSCAWAAGTSATSAWTYLPGGTR